VLVAILGVLRLLQGSIAPPPPDTEQPQAGRPSMTPVTADAPPPPRDERADVGTHERDEPPPDLTLPNEFTLRVTVVDAFGLPIEGARLFVAPALTAFGVWPDPTDARGELLFRCRGRATSLRLWTVVMVFGTAQSLQVVTLASGIEGRLVVASPGRARDPSPLLELLDQGANWQQIGIYAHDEKDREQRLRKRGVMPRRDEQDTLCGRELMLFRLIDCTVCHDRSRIGSYNPLQWAPLLGPPLPAPLAAAQQTPPSTRLSKRLATLLDIPSSLPPPTPPPATPRAARGEDRIDARFRDLSLRPPEQRESAERARELRWKRLGRALRRPREQDDGPQGTVAGRVATADAHPTAGVQVAWIAANGAVLARAATNEDGRYRLQVPANAACSLVCAGGPLGRAEAMVTAPAGGEAQQNFLLERRAVVRGIAVDAAGAPLSGWRVFFLGTDEPGAAVTTTDEQGTFAFSHLPRSGRCMLWPQDADLRLPVLATEPLLPDGPPIRTALSEQAPSRAHLRLHPRLPPGHEQARIEVRLLQTETGFATHVEASRFDDAFELEGLPPGFYEGEIGAQGLGWVPFGPVHLDGRGLWDVGVIALPAPGRVRIVVADPADSPLVRGALFVRRDPDTDVIADPMRLADDVVSLPAGDYVLVYHDRDGRHARALVVSADTETKIALP